MWPTGGLKEEAIGLSQLEIVFGEGAELRHTSGNLPSGRCDWVHGSFLVREVLGDGGGLGRGP